jgi:SEC-C motif-containing protein
MRSRFSAFALGLGDYLVRTMDEEVDERELSRAKDRQRFLDLKILHADETTVLFYAKIFERGVDRSFAELSTFRREGEGWIYTHGVSIPRDRLPADLEALTPSRFLEIASSR